MLKKYNCIVQRKVLMFLTLVPKANFYIFRFNNWSRTIAVYLLVKTLFLAVDHPLSLIVFLYKVKYLTKSFVNLVNFTRFVNFTFQFIALFIAIIIIIFFVIITIIFTVIIIVIIIVIINNT